MSNGFSDFFCFPIGTYIEKHNPIQIVQETYLSVTYFILEST